MKFQTKITILFSLSISLVFTAAILLTGLGIIRYDRSITTRLNTQLIESKAAEAGSWLEQRISELRIISRSDMVMDMDDNLKNFVNRLNDERSYDYGNDYGTFAIGGLDGLGYVTDEQTIDISERDYFIEAMNSSREYVLSSPVDSRTDFSRIILICYPVYNQENEKVGFVNGAVSLNRLTQLAEGIRFYDGTSLILDSTGEIYTNVPENITAPLLEQIISNIPEGTVDGTYIKSLKIKSQDFMFFYVPVPNTDGWYLCTIAERSRVVNESRLLLTTIITIWMLLLVVIFILSFYISRMVTKPIKQLRAGMNHLQTGDFQVKIKPQGKDEVAFLTESFNRMVMDIQSLIKQNADQQREKYQLRLQMFQSQIKPHFLYNTLDTLHWQALEYEALDMADIISALSAFFRSTLSKGDEFITLSEELVHIGSYLKIQNFRYSDILESELNFSEQIGDCQIARLLIQPLIENGIYHGIKPSLRKGRLLVSLEELEDEIKVSVADDGVGMDEDEVRLIMANISGREAGSSYGLYNVNQRIQLIYGNRYGLKITSKKGCGTKIWFHIPKVKAGDIYEPHTDMR